MTGQSMIASGIRKVAEAASESLLRQRGYVSRDEILPKEGYVRILTTQSDQYEKLIIAGKEVYQHASHIYSDTTNDSIIFTGTDNALYNASHTSYGEHRLDVTYPGGGKKSHLIFPDSKAADKFINPNLFREYQQQHDLFLAKMRALPLVIDVTPHGPSFNESLERYGQFLVRLQRMNGLLVIGDTKVLPNRSRHLMKASFEQKPVLGGG